MTDLLVANALVVDGTGAPAFTGGVVVDGDRITRVIRPGEPEPPALRRIDAGGHALAPGFIDVHTHSDMTPFVEPGMESMLRQGVTTVVVGNCGGSAFPAQGATEMGALAGVAIDLVSDWSTFGDYLERLDACHPAMNVAALVGHGTLRQVALGGDQRREPTHEEMGVMRRLLAQALDEGAVGLSTGLIYVPGLYASTAEVAGLAGVLHTHGGVYASHVRGEGESVFAAVAECIEIGRRAHVPSHVSHLKVEGRTMWGRAGALLDLIDAALATGADVSMDQYPYTAWETELAAALPPWVTPAELPSVLADAEATARLREATERGEPGWESPGPTLGWDRVMLGSFEPDPALTGRSIADIAAERDEEPFRTIAALLLEDRYAGMLGHGMHEDDVRAIVRRPDVFVASDGLAVAPTGPLGSYAVHPRYYGTFARVLARYVREGRLLTLEDAVRKMTSLPAERFALAGRGRIAVGAFADLVVFDPQAVADRATFEHPHAFAEGVDLVVVNGRVAWDGTPGERAGRSIRRGVA